MPRSLTTPTRSPSPSHPIRAGGASLGAILWTWHERWRQRRILEELDTDRLDDIGLTRKQVIQEAAKPFWRR